MSIIFALLSSGISIYIVFYNAFNHNGFRAQIYKKDAQIFFFSGQNCQIEKKYSLKCLAENRCSEQNAQFTKMLRWKCSVTKKYSFRNSQIFSFEKKKKNSYMTG